MSMPLATVSVAVLIALATLDTVEMARFVKVSLRTKFKIFRTTFVYSQQVYIPLYNQL